MSRLELLDPNGTLDASLALDAYLLIDGPYTEHYVDTLHRLFGKLTKLELHIIYDWAMREHLSAAGNNIRRRERPGLFKLIDKAYQSGDTIATAIQDRDSAQARIEELEEENEILQTRIAALESQVEIAGSETPDGGNLVH